jgi:hypothetical protein
MVNPQRMQDPEYLKEREQKLVEAHRIVEKGNGADTLSLLQKNKNIMLSLMLGVLLFGWLSRDTEAGLSRVIGKILATEIILAVIFWAYASFPKNMGANVESTGEHYVIIFTLSGVIAVLWAGKIAEVISFSLIHPSTDASPMASVSEVRQRRAPARPNKSSAKKKIVLTSPSLEGTVTAKPFTSQRKESSRLGGTPLENAIAENRLGTAEELFQEQMKKEPANFDLFIRYLKFKVINCGNKTGAQNAVQKKCREDVFTLEQMETASKEVNQARG